MNANKSVHDVIVEVTHYIEALKTQLISNLPPIEPKPGEKLLRMSILCRETLLHRIVDLSSAAKDMFQEGRLVPGCTLTRSLYETVAIDYYLLTKIQKAIDNQDIEGIVEVVYRGFWGSRDGKTNQKALQVLTAVDHMDKLFTGSRSEYDHLCEYAHPNMKGGFGTYTKIDIPSLRVEFGQNPQNIPIDAFGLGALAIILQIAIDIHEKLLQVEGDYSKFIYNHAPGIFKD